MTLLVLLVSSLCCGARSPDVAYDLVLPALDQPWSQIPLMAFLPDQRLEERHPILFDAQEQPVAVVVEPSTDGLCVWWIGRDLSAGEEHRWMLALRQAPMPALPVRDAVQLVTEQGKDVEVRLGKQLLTRFVCDPTYPKPFCYPLEAFGGLGMTRGWPVEEGIEGESHDHSHHRSMWFGYGDVDGIDFWADPSPDGSGRVGRVVHREFERLESNAVFGLIASRQEWVAPGGDVPLESVEEWRFFNTPENPVIDVSVELRPRHDSVRFGDSKEGMMAVRLCPSLKEIGGGQLRNSEGLVSEKALWGKPANWCDASGKIGDRMVGLAMFDHPSNFRHPTCWHARAYGLMAANPFGLRHFTGDASRDGSWTLSRDDHPVFRYRIFLHPGDAMTGHVEEAYRLYAIPVSAQKR